MRKVAGTLVFGLFLGACGGSVEREAAGHADAVGRLSAGLIAFDERDGYRAGGAQLSEAPFLAPDRIRADQSQKLPAKFRDDRAVTLASRDPMTLVDVAEALTRLTGISHVLALGPTGTPVPVGGAGPAADSAADDGPDTGAIPPKATARIRVEDGTASLRQTIRPNLRGSLGEVLDRVASEFAVEWSFADGRVLFRDFVTRQYQVSALPVTGSTTSAVAGTSSASSSDLWSEIEAGLEGVAGSGSSISIGRGSGVVTVTARIPDQDRVRDFLAKMNANLGQQIAFDVNVITVTLSESDGIGINLQAALAGDGGQVGWDGGLSVGNQVGAVNFGLVRGNFSLDAVISSLSRQGRVTIETRTGATTTNNRVVPVEVTDEISYVAEVSTTSGSGDTVSTAITPDTIETGFKLILLPRILNRREVMVQYALDLSDLNGLTTFTSGVDSVQLPEVSRTAFEQQVVLETGQTLVLAGFERQRSTRSKSGAFHAAVPLPGGSAEREVERVASVVTITPRLLVRGGKR